MFLTAEFSDAPSVGAALRALKADGFDAAQMDVFSTEPVELPGGLLERPSHMSLAAVTGAASLCILAIVFVRYTQYDYRLVTGGMPLFSWWATGVIFYEFTMFGAIVAMFATFLVESGLLKRHRAIPAPVLVAGRIQVRVCCDAGRAVAAAECLRKAGALNVVES
jgi:Alternative complex III, ActD subunit